MTAVRRLRHGRRRIFEEFPGFRYLDIQAASSTTEPAIVEGASIAVPISRAFFSYCELTSPRGTFSDCSAVPPDRVRVRYGCRADRATMVLTKRVRRSCDTCYMEASWRAVVCAVVLLGCAAGCASAARQPGPGSGRLTVGVTATGPSPSAASLRVVIESTGIDGSVKADAGVFTSDDVPFGTHLVRLTGVPSACRVDDGAERKITINEQRRFAVLRFNLTCH